MWHQIFTPLLNETQKMKSITLVLDLDETLVHSTLEHCEDVDFSFPVFFNMKEHRVYVKQRPYLQMFLERVAEIFEIVVFTASQSIYAKQLMDILDPDRKLISHRAYRGSCIFSDGSCTEDLTVLGVDLAKIAIIDNSPWGDFLPIDFHISFVKNIWLIIVTSYIYTYDFVNVNVDMYGCGCGCGCGCRCILF